MTNRRPPQARVFLKQLGFSIDKKPHQQKRLLLESLSMEQQARIELIWEMRDSRLATGLEQYLIPDDLRQAAFLFSSDWPRMIASFEWLDQIVSSTNCKSMVEMGCGPGFLLKYLLERYPGIKIQGLDTAANLIRIGAKLCDSPLIAGDYLTAAPDHAYGACNLQFRV